MNNSNIILTTYNPETFLYVSGDTSNNVTINISPKSNSGYIYVDAKRVDLTDTIDISYNLISNNYIRIFVDPRQYNEFSFDISVKLTDGKFKKTIEYKPTIIKDSNDEVVSVYNYPYNSNILSSFMLIRTNPKLTGNIKLVVDSSDNMFLDTFPINPTLANKKYRKQRISTESYYSNDIRNVFGNTPSGDLYDLPKLEKDSTIPISDYNDQYVNTYYYGVRNNFDNLYKENFAMLAPLWINKNLPEFFVIFKYDDIYSNDASTAADDINNIIKNGKIIKYFDLRKNTVIGNYLRRHQSEIENYLNSVKISYNDNNDIEWNGISVRSGIMTTAKDSTYDINHVENQVMHDKYITLGYERNDLISPYIINFEFMFDDKTSEDFKINRYVGLYLTSDKFEEWNSSDVSLNSKIKNIINEEKDDAFMSITSFIKDNEFTLCNELFNKNSDDIIKSIKNKTDKSSISLLCNKEQNDIKYFNLTIKKPLKCGEHFRIIKNEDNKKYNKGEYWDVIGAKMSDDILNLDTVDDANKMEVFYNVYNNETINKFNNDITVHSTIFTGYFNNYANIFYNDNDSDIIKVQISQIARSFLKMSDIPFKILYYTDDTIAFACENKDIDLYFERITSDITHDLVNLAFDSNTSSSVTYFDNIEFDAIKISSIDNNNLLYKCNYFEVEGDRYAQIFKFLDIKNYVNILKSDINNSISRVSTDIDWVVNVENTMLEDKFIKFPTFKINYVNIDSDNLSNVEYEFNYIKSPNNTDLAIVNNEDNLIIKNNKIFIYEAAKINFNYVNFLAVKDFNFGVLDGDKIKTVYETSIYTEFGNDTSLGPIVNNNTFETYNDYVNANSNLLVPYINKWEINGTDTFGNKIKATNNFDKIDISSFYLADNTKENSNIFANMSLNMPKSFKSNYENMFYIKHDINDICKEDIDNDSSKYINAKESILNQYNALILFKDDEYINSRFSVLNYNSDLNILETVFRGRHINITFNQNNLITKNFNNYLFTIICSPSSNMDRDCDVEIIVDTITEMVICIYYTEIGNLYYPDIVNYTKKCVDNSTSFIRYPYDLDIYNIVNSNYIPYKQDYSKDISANKISLGENSALYLSDIVIPESDSLYANDNYTYSIKLNTDNSMYMDEHRDILDISGTSIFSTFEKYTKLDLNNDRFDTSTDAKIRPNNNVIYEYLIDCSLKNKISFSDIENRNNILYIKRRDGDNNVVTELYDNIVTIKAAPLSEYIIQKYDVSKNENNTPSLVKTIQKYKYIEYGCNPEFVDIFEYKSSNKFIGSNNKIKLINPIKCVYNKGDINDTTKNVYINDSLDITKSIWNKKLYGKNFDKTASELGIINSMFFGSIGLVYFNDIEIEINSSDLTKISDNIKTYNNSNDSNIVDIYTLNIKNYIIESILNNNFKVISNDKSVVKNFNLYDNWKNDVNTNVIYNFIYDILMNRYNMDINNKTNIEVKRQISNKNKIGDRFIKTNSGTTNANLKIDINGDILRIEIPRDEYQYSIKYKIKNKHGY